MQTPVQTPAATPREAAVTRAAESITAEALTNPSIAGANSIVPGQDATDRAALDARAAALAEQFRALGLQPISKKKVGTIKDWVVHYPLPGQLRFDYAKSSVQVFQAVAGPKGQPVLDETRNEIVKVMTAKFDTSAYFAPQVGPPLVGEKVLLSFRSALVAGSHRAMVVAGPQTPATLRGLDLSDRAVFYIPAIGADSAARRQVLDTLYQGSRGVIVVADQDSAAFDRELQAARRATVPVVEGYMRQATADRWPWAVVVRAAQLRRLWSVLDLDEAQLRTTPAPLALEVPSTEAWFFPSIDSVSNVVTAPDVVGVLEGADSVLKKEYVIVNASLDASGPLALLALARAFSQPGARPPRSVLFVAASGAAPTYAGMWFVTNPTYWRRLAAFPPHRVAALTIGPLAPLPGDSLVIDGGADFTFGIAPVWIGAAHPELGVHAVDGGTAFQPETAGNAFARNSVPTLAFHGTGGKSAAAATGPSTPRDAERAAAALRLVFYVAQELANTTSPIQWTEAGRSRSIGASAVQP